jgi:hypothetical protein
MIFYYEINTDRHILATNIAAVSEFSGLPYHKIRNWFVNGSSVHKDENYICIQTEIIRGKQRIQKKEKKGKIDSRTTISGNGGPDHPVLQEETQVQKRTTKQPANRDMSGFDDFFKDVK